MQRGGASDNGLPEERGAEKEAFAKFRKEPDSNTHEVEEPPTEEDLVPLKNRSTRLWSR